MAASWDLITAQMANMPRHTISERRSTRHSRRRKSRISVCRYQAMRPDTTASATRMSSRIKRLLGTIGLEASSHSG